MCLESHPINLSNCSSFPPLGRTHSFKINRIISSHFFVNLSCCWQIMISFENASYSTTEETANATGSASLAVTHDASADEMKEAILSLAEGSLDAAVGTVDVSREANGAEGLQAYRCVCVPDHLCQNDVISVYNRDINMAEMIRNVGCRRR